MRASEIRGRRTIAAAEAALEMGQVVEPGRERDRGQRAVAEPWIAEQAMRASRCFITYSVKVEPHSSNSR
jgi:hypothetical protein